MKTRRNRGGHATSVTMTAYVGARQVTFVQQVEKADLEEMALLKAEAELYKQLAKARADLNAEQSSSGWPYVWQWFEHWFHERYVAATWYPAFQSGTEIHVRKHWNLLVDDIGNHSMDRITPAVMSKAFSKVAATHAQSYLRMTWHYMNQLFCDAVKFGWDDGYGRVRWRARFNPMDSVQQPFPQPTQRVILSDWMMAAVIKRIEERNPGPEVSWKVAVPALQVLLGLRVSEPCLLRWEQLYIGEGHGCAGSITWRPGQRKRGQPLVLPLPFAALRYLPMHRREKDGRIWDKGLVRHMTEDVNTELRGACDDIGIPSAGVSSHCLRHSFAHSLRSLGEDVGAIQQALGHASQRTTEVYLRGLPDMKKTAMAVLPRAERIFGDR